MENSAAPTASIAPTSPAAPNQPSFQGGTQGSQSSSGFQDSSSTSNQSNSQQSAPEIFEIKSNGRVVKMTRREVIDHASMSYAATAKFQEAAQTRKQVDKIINTAKTSPIEALMDPSLGLTKDQIRDAFEKWYKKEYIDPETLSPQEREFNSMKEELERRRREDQDRDVRTKQEKEQLETAQYRQEYERQIVEALEKSDLPKTKYIASRVAFYLRQNNQNGWDAPMSLIVSQVKREQQQLMTGQLSGIDGDGLIGLLGEDIVNKIRQADLRRLRSKRYEGHQQSNAASYSSSSTDERISYSDVNKRLREMRQGKW